MNKSIESAIEQLIFYAGAASGLGFARLGDDDVRERMRETSKRLLELRPLLVNLTALARPPPGGV